MELTRRSLIAGALAAPLVGAVPAWAQAEETWDQRWKRMLTEDFAMLGRYRAENEALIASRAPVDIVFLGDSITEGWKDKRPGFFTPGRVNRGISGQTTAQMVLRMVPDVIDLKPRAVHIMAGTNDIAGNTGPMTPEMTRDNFRAMTALAQRHGLKVLLATIPPANGFPWRPGLETVRPIRELNAWIRAYAREVGAVLVDYDPVLAAPDGGMRAGLTYDGVHPGEAGYDAMASVAEPALRQLVRRRR